MRSDNFKSDKFFPCCDGKFELLIPFWWFSISLHTSLLHQITTFNLHTNLLTHILCINSYNLNIHITSFHYFILVQYLHLPLLLQQRWSLFFMKIVICQQITCYFVVVFKDLICSDKNTYELVNSCPLICVLFHLLPKLFENRLIKTLTTSL